MCCLEKESRTPAPGSRRIDGSVPGFGSSAAESEPIDQLAITILVLRLQIVEQLAPLGRIVIPIGEHPRSQTMRRYRMGEDGQLGEEHLGGFAFVPLVGECGWGEDE